MSALSELRGLVADKLVWWAWRLDRERFLAIDEKGRPVVDAADLYYSERQLLKRCPEAWVALARIVRLREEVRALESYPEALEAVAPCVAPWVKFEQEGQMSAWVTREEYDRALGALLAHDLVPGRAHAPWERTS